ncbi:MAG: serine/threonine-protein kinase [Deltaproteobacteria bacterium]|nr:serine/threonine-protein kinase [Deltaproteobacteria bacterium]
MTQFKPKQFGKYYLLEKLAVGGMAEIYKAKTFGAEGFEKLLAIKRILPHASEDKEFINMLIDEAKLSVLLSHANIVQVYDLGKVGTDYFISMEFIDGINLRDVLYRLREQTKKMPVDLAVYLASEICKGLDYAHRKTDDNNQPLEIVHRDISPQNILISYEGEVKIVDFGIAKAAMNISHTMAGILKGKIAYMSPEQAMGKSVDARTDLFSLGIILYESLTGNKLFTGESQFEVLKKIRTTRIEAERLPNNIPEPLRKILAKILAFKPEERFATAGDLQVTLTQFLYSNYTDFSPRKLAAFVHDLFREKLDEKQEKDQAELLEAKTGSISVMQVGKSQELLVHRESSESKKREVTHPILFSKSITKSFRLASIRLATRLLVPLIVLGGIGFGGYWWYSQKTNAVQKTSTAIYGTVHVESDPPGAAILIDNKQTPFKTPAILDRLRIDQAYAIALNLEEYTEEEKTVRVQNEEPVFLSFDLLKKPTTIDVTPPKMPIQPIVKGSLLIDSEPGGAQIFIDNQDSGKVTPATIGDLEIGRRFVIQLRKENFKTIEKLVTIASGEPIILKEQLGKIAVAAVPKTQPPVPKPIPAKPEPARQEPAPKPTPKPVTPPKPEPQQVFSGTGSIQFASKPSGADIFINGEKVGSTPQTVKVPAGRVKILITKGSDTLPCQKTILIKNDQTEKFNCTLGPLFGKIDILSIPSRAEVYFDNKKMDGKTPMTIKKIKRDGNHTLRIELNGYQPWEKAFDLTEEENEVFHIQLEKKI